jgi:RNA polymerase sigma-70 factor, ECF subfamily
VDRDLVKRAIAGDRDAYTELVRQSIDRSYALAMLVLRDPDRARDATQEAYVAAWRDLASVRDADRIDGWLRRLVVRACHDELRRQGRRRRIEVREIALAGPGAVSDTTLAVAQRDELERGFRRLQPDQRTALVLRYYLDLPIEEVADALGVPVGTAKSRLNRATQAMRASLDADARGSLLPEGPSA